MNKTERIKSLVVQLNEARKAYYAEDREIMSNLEYDKLYEELEPYLSPAPMLPVPHITYHIPGYS